MVEVCENVKGQGSVPGLRVANSKAAGFAEYLVLGTPCELLLCTDGYYRAVDCYGLYSEEGLLTASLMAGGIDGVLSKIRVVEATDPTCKKYPRFKPADDATAIVLQESA